MSRPTALRATRRGGDGAAPGWLTLRLTARAPYAADEVLLFLGAHAVPPEHPDADAYLDFVLADVGTYEPNNLNRQHATVDDLGPWVDSARSTKGQRLETWFPTDRMILHQRAVDSGVTAATITALLDQAKANKEWVILTFHQVRASPTLGTTQAVAQAIIDHAASIGIAVRPVVDVLAANPTVAG